MEEYLKKYSQQFYDLDVTITGMCCLGLLDAGNANAVRQLEEILRTDDADEIAAVFGFQDGELGEDEIDFACILDMRYGWFVQAEAANYLSNGVYRLITVYKDTLEDALAEVVATATAERERIFALARKE